MNKLELAKKALVEQAQAVIEAVRDRYEGEIQVTGINIKIINHKTCKGGTPIVDDSIVTGVELYTTL